MHFWIWILLGLFILMMYLIYKVHSMRIEKNQKNREEIIKTLEKYGDLKENVSGDLLKYNYQENIYEVLIWRVPKSCEITFNSRKIWEIRKGSKVILKDMSSFVVKPGKKIVIITPKQDRLKRWENENELKFIKPDESFWNMNAVFIDDLEITLKNGFK